MKRANTQNTANSPSNLNALENVTEAGTPLHLLIPGLEIRSGKLLAEDRLGTCWSKIIGYLELQDILALSSSAKELKGIVEDCMKTNPPAVTIDKECLERFPLHGNKDLYGALGQNVRELQLRDLFVDQDLEVISHFPAIHCLSLSRCEIRRKYSAGFPITVQILRLIECVIQPEFMKEWFLSLRPNLEDVLLHRSTYDCRSAKLPHCDLFLENLPGIKHLRLHEMSSRMQWGEVFKGISLSTLIIRDCQRIGFGVDNFDLKQVKVLHCESISSDIKSEILEDVSFGNSGNRYHTLQWLTETKSVNTLTSLTMSTPEWPLDWVTRFKRLERLTFTDPLTVTQAEKLLSAIKSMVVNIPRLKFTTIKDTVPDSILALDEYCLREIFSKFILYDRILDIFAVALTHPTLEEVILTMNWDTIFIADDILKKYPLKQHLSLYKALGKRTKNLELCRLKEWQCVEVLAFFQGIESLGFLPAVELNWSLENIPRVTKLVTDHALFHPQYLCKLLAYMSPTLEILECDKLTPESLSLVGNLKEIKMNGDVLLTDLPHFWVMNQTLEKIVVTFPDAYDRRGYADSLNWIAVASLPNLRKLEFKAQCRSWVVGTVPFFRNLVELKLELYMKDDREKIVCAMGPQLEILHIEGRITEPMLAHIKTLDSLKKLYFFGTKEQKFYDLKVDGLIRALPNLVDLSVLWFKWSLDFEDKASAYLRKENRTLKLSNDYYDVVLG